MRSNQERDGKWVSECEKVDMLRFCKGITKLDEIEQDMVHVWSNLSITNNIIINKVNTKISVMSRMAFRL